MQVTVLFFGVLRDLFGASEQIALPEQSRVLDVIERYRERALHLGSFWNSIAVAINGHYATGVQSLSAGDEVALLPPVSGGAAILLSTCR